MIVRFIVLFVLVLTAACSRPTLEQVPSVSPLIDKVSDHVKQQAASVYLDPAAFNPRPFGVIERQSVIDADDSLLQPMQACFQGTIEALLAAIAAKTGYRWRFEGVRPAAPILVSVNRSGSSAYAILEDGLLQAQGMVRLRITLSSRMMTLRYKRHLPRSMADLDERGL